MKYKFERISFRVLLLVVSAVLSSVYAQAQAMGPCDPFDPEPDCTKFDPDTEVPIDGGASILIAAGVAYGIKKIYDKRKAKAQEEMI